MNRRPAPAPPFHEEEDGARYAKAEDRGVHEIDFDGSRFRFGQDHFLEQEANEGDGDVDPKDRAPVPSFGEIAAEKRGEDQKGGADADKESCGFSPLIGREKGSEKRGLRWAHQSGADSLHRSSGDQRSDVIADAAEKRGDAKEDHPPKKDARVADPVAPFTSGEDEDGCGEKIGVDGPLEQEIARSELGLDGG